MRAARPAPWEVVRCPGPGTPRAPCRAQPTSSAAWVNAVAAVRLKMFGWALLLGQRCSRCRRCGSGVRTSGWKYICMSLPSCATWTLRVDCHCRQAAAMGGTMLAAEQRWSATHGPAVLLTAGSGQPRTVTGLKMLHAAAGLASCATAPLPPGAIARGIVTVLPVTGKTRLRGTRECGSKEPGTSAILHGTRFAALKSTQRNGRNQRDVWTVWASTFVSLIHHP